MGRLSATGLMAAACVPGVLCAQTACPVFVTQGAGLITPGETKVLSAAVLTGAHMATSQGTIDVNLLLDSAPNTSANFLRYVRSGRYDGVMFHRSVPLSVQTQIGVIQSGGYRSPTQGISDYPTPQQPLVAAQRPSPVATYAPIALEHPVGNVRGTLAMARTFDPNSATSQFFINTADNNADVPGERFSLDAVAGQPGREGYGVFGMVTPASLAVIDSIATRSVMDVSSLFEDYAFSEVPLRRPYENELTLPLLPAQYVTIFSASATATPAASWSMGAGLMYRWKRDGVYLTDGGRYSGTQTSVMTVTGASILDTGVYVCEVSGLACGPAATEPLTVQCPADLGSAGGVAGPDGTLNNDDFIVFIDHFFQHNPQADVGAGGGVPQADGLWDNNDFIVYIDMFFGGC